MKAPGVEPRRFSDFEKELRERAAAWVPTWGIADGERDFGRALLEAAARFNSDVAERLDRVGDKMARGFLDWLAIRGEAARPARLPVVFKLADTAREPVQAPRPVKMQVDAHGATVTFETETDVRLVPGRIELIVGADPAKDAFFLPPAGLSSLDPVDPVPTRWQLKSFAAAGSATLQLDPSAGLIEGMLVEIAGAQYRIASAKGDLATIDPPVPAGDGFAIGMSVTKVAAFLPFEQARDQQDHVLYLGDSDLFNIEAEAAISVHGASSLGTQATWEYWGKLKSAPSETEPRWRALDVDVTNPAALILKKPQGSIDPREIGAAKARWLRARIPHLDATQPLLTPDEIAIEVNAPPATPPDVSPIEVIVNTAPSAPNQFFPLGREPRMFDTLYVGSAEAFSKPGAQAEIEFDLVEPSLSAMAAIDAGGIGHVLAGVDKTGALHLFKIAADGTLSPLRIPVVPAGSRLTSMKFRPVMWMDGSDLHIAVAAGDQVWVWREAWPNPAASGWESFDAPRSNTDPQSKVDGLAAIKDPSIGAQLPLLVALRDKRLKMHTAHPGGAWSDLAAEAPPGTALDIEAIVQVSHETFGNFADSLVAVAQNSLTLDSYAVDANSAVNSLLPDIAQDVTPFAIQRSSNILEVVAVNNTPRKLSAKKGGNAAVFGDIELTHQVVDATLDARIESGEFTAYCIAKPATGSPGVPDLLAWIPFDPDPDVATVVFRTPSDPSIGSPQGGLTLFDSFAYTPGDKRGEILAAKLGGTRSRWSAADVDFRSALAVFTPVPAMAAGDVISVDVGNVPTPAVVDPASAINGRGSYSNQRFIPLDRWLDCDTSSVSIPLYQSSGTGFNGATSNTVNKLNLQPGDPAISTPQTLPEWILVDDNTPVLKIVKVTAINGSVADIGTSLALNIAVSYWWPSATLITGRIFPTLKLGGGNDNWTIDALDHGGIYFPSLDPQRQQVIAAAVDTSLHPQWLAFESKWLVPPTALIIKFVVDDMLTQWIHLLGDNSSNPTLSWEYWNGTGWWMLKIDDDDTNNLKNSGLVKFTVPPDIGPVEWVGKKNHWVRARLTGGDYGQPKVTIVSTTSGNTTTQTIDRSDSGIQPPYALSVSVRYRLGEIKPAYLLTQDSGTLRDQSDANRTSGALIEVFTPMIYALRQFDSAAARAADPESGCVPDCDCPSGTASTSPALKTPAPAASPDTPVPPSRTERRAIFLGLDSKLLGEPINILLAVQQERLHDRLAPMAIDALIGNRFVPLVAKDDTRALGETGLISMSFSVEPTPTELFGRSLSWLRLTPGGADVEWKPTLSGAYLNAVWAHAAETMTRELLGGSQGAPGLTVQLARPPLLHDSLELRIKEPLGKEQRDQLVDADPDLVKSGITDLPGDWVLWKQVTDPVDYDANARVYSLDEDTGVIRFGDGQHGAIPPIGPDVIMAFKYERTEPTTADGGVPANFVSARTPLNLVTPVETVESAVAADQAAGGIGPESGERVLHFGAARLRHRGRILTARDFEDFALEQFADVVQARCFVSGGRVRLVVVMRGANAMPSHAQQRELTRLLLGAAPSTLAAAGALTIEGPAVRRLRVALTLRVPTLDVAGAVASEVKERLQSYFDTEFGSGAHEGWPLGASPREDDVAQALLDVPDLQSIESIALLEVDPANGERPWPTSLKKSELAMLAADGVRIAFDLLEAAA